MRVQRKLVSAIESEVRVGEVNPRSENMVAEKYIREFYVDILSSVIQRGRREREREREELTYETTQLL